MSVIIDYKDCQFSPVRWGAAAPIIVHFYCKGGTLNFLSNGDHLSI